MVFIANYSLGIFQNSLPVISDFLAHTFNKIDHINTVHYENGHYHVHKEQKKITEKNKNEEQKSDTKNKKKLDLHTVILNERQDANNIYVVLTSHVFCFSKTVIFKAELAPDPPPEILKV